LLLQAPPATANTLNAIASHDRPVRKGIIK
jgi:hypothetical protein